MKIETIIKLNKFVPRPYQKKICQAFEKGYKKMVIVAHRRMGKDIVCFNLMIRAAIKKVGIYYYLLPNAVQARRVMFDGITNDGQKILDFIPKELIKGINIQQMKITLFNDSQITFVGSENHDSLRGTNPIGCVFSEYAYQHPQAYPTIRPILLANDGWAIFVSTPFGENHFYTLYKIAQDFPKEWYSCLMTIEDTQQISSEEVQREIDSGEISSDLAIQEYFCDFKTGAVGSYYAKYLNNMELNNQIGNINWEPNYPVHSAWDLGMKDSTVILMFQVIGNSVHIIDMYEKNSVGLEHYINVLQSKEYTWGKHFAPHDISVRDFTAGGLSRFEKAAQLGVRFVIAPKLSIIDGIECVRTTLPRIYIDKDKCAPLIKAIRDYRKEYDTKLKVYKNKPLHDHNCFTGNHCVLTIKGLIPIKDIRIGDVVITPTGKRKVVNVFKKTVNNLNEVSIGNKKILCTSTHEFFTQRGIVKSDSLRYTDIVESFSKLRSFLWKKMCGYCTEEHGIKGFKKTILSLKTNHLSCLMDIYIDGMRQNTIWAQAEHLIQGSLYSPLFSDICGKNIMVRFQMGMLFITRIGTLETMIFRTWNFLLEKSTEVYMLLNQTHGQIATNAKNILDCKEKKQKNGTLAQKESHGINNTQKYHCLQLWVKNTLKCAICAIRSIWHRTYGKNFVAMPVKQGKEYSIVLTLKKGIVLYAIKSLNVINMLLKRHVVKNVQHLQLDTPREVYDIEVEHDNCYYIDGYLVSNSNAADALRYLCLSLPKTRAGLTPEQLEKRYREAVYGEQSNQAAFFRDDLPPY